MNGRSEDLNTEVLTVKALHLVRTHPCWNQHTSYVSIPTAGVCVDTKSKLLWQRQAQE